MLLEYANSYELNSGNGLSGFVRYIDSVMESKGDFRSGNVSASSQNAVYMKTMQNSRLFLLLKRLQNSVYRISLSLFSFLMTAVLGLSFRIRKSMKSLLLYHMNIFADIIKINC